MGKKKIESGILSFDIHNDIKGRLRLMISTYKNLNTLDGHKVVEVYAMDGFLIVRELCGDEIGRMKI